MVVISDCSLITGDLTDNFRDKDVSLTGIFIASDIQIKIMPAIFSGIGYQMAVLPEDALRLQASRVTQRCEDPGKNVPWSGPLTAKYGPG
jgi:hypothetical protein